MLAEDTIRYVDGRRMQCKDIPDAAFLDAVRQAPCHRSTAWDVHNELEDAIGPVPANLFYAKAHRLIERGLIGGCACGCSGRFFVAGECACCEIDDFNL